jgi:hypothetical protein
MCYNLCEYILFPSIRIVYINLCLGDSNADTPFYNVFIEKLALVVTDIIKKLVQVMTVDSPSQSLKKPSNGT